MIRKLVLSLVAVLGISAMSFAQNLQVSGRVSGTDGSPIVGATVLVEGSTTNGTSTDIAGEFTLRAPSNGNLVVSFIGYETKTVAINGQTAINVTLEEDAEMIEDVTVVAFGTKRKQDLVGSVTKVKSQTIENSQASSVSKALEGAVAGLQVVSSSGQPGSDGAIVIRGIGSMSAGQTALIVVDGVPFNGSLSDLNPSDIESISVSKDAVSNSLYGSRAANGVVMVTTKTGRKEATQIAFKASWGVNSRAYEDYDMVTNPAEFYELSWYGIRNTAWIGGRSLPAANLFASQNLLKELAYNAFIIPQDQYLVGTDGKLNPNAKLRYDDSFADALFDSSFRQEYNVSASGATDRTNYYMSVGYLDDDSYVLGSSYERITSRLNVNTQVAKWLRVGMNLAYSKTTTHGVNETSGQASNAFDVARSWAPIYPVHAYDAEGNVKLDANGNPMYDDGLAGTTDGSGTRPTAINQNVIASMSNDVKKTDIHNLNTRYFVEVKFLKDFTFTANYAYDYSTSSGTNYYTPIIGDGMSFNGRSTKSSQWESTNNFNQILAYSKNFGNHSIEAKLGHEHYMYRYGGLSGQKTNFYDLSNPELSNGGEMISLTSYTLKHNIEGYFAMADYNYAHKYYVSAAFRRDGTSRFKERWGNFWTVGAGWRISAENFMQGAQSWLNDLKLRASYGTQGNENMPGVYNAYEDQYAVTWDGTSLGTSIAFYGNPELTWEKQTTFDVGLDFALGGFVTGTFDYFYRLSDDMLYKKTLNPSAGRNYNWENLCKMSNQGVEIELNFNIFKRRDLQWSVSVNGSHYINEVITLPEENREDGIQSGNFKLMEGKSYYEYYMKRYAGINDQGQATWWEKSEVPNAENPEIIETVYTKTTAFEKATYEFIGKQALPDFTGGLSTQFSYKGLDVSVATAFQIGGWGYDSNYVSTLSTSYYIGHHKDMWDTWNPETKSGKYPIWNRASQNGYTQTSDVHLVTASYFSIRNITVGYTFPKAWMNKIGVGSLRVYVAADNVALFSARQGYDPRVSLSGGNGSFGGYSPLRTISGGINLTF